MAKKERLDNLVVKQGLADDIDQARRIIMAGEIRTGDRLWDKAGEKIPLNTILELKSKRLPFVSRGGIKLEHALKQFHISAKGKTCLDIGASTGGFTHVLLLNHASEVYALDVGSGLLDPRISLDDRVKVYDKTNFRLLPPDYFANPFLHQSKGQISHQL